MTPWLRFLWKWPSGCRSAWPCSTVTRAQHQTAVCSATSFLGGKSTRRGQKTTGSCLKEKSSQKWTFVEDVLTPWVCWVRTFYANFHFWFKHSLKIKWLSLFYSCYFAQWKFKTGSSNKLMIQSDESDNKMHWNVKKKKQLQYLKLCWISLTSTSYGLTNTLSRKTDHEVMFSLGFFLLDQVILFSKQLLWPKP